jgi:DNA-binding MurR/RpiR family transcriptional regulator
MPEMLERIGSYQKNLTPSAGDLFEVILDSKERAGTSAVASNVDQLCQRPTHRIV